MGGGSAQVNPPHQVSIAEGLREQLGDRLVVVDGVRRAGAAAAGALDAIRDPETGEPGMRVEHVDADGVVMLEEHSRRLRRSPRAGTTPCPGQTEQVRLQRPARQRRARCASGAKGAGSWRISVDGTEIGAADLAAEGADPGEAMFKPPSWTADVEASAGALVEAELTVVRSEPQPGPDGSS